MRQLNHILIISNEATKTSTLKNYISKTDTRVVNHLSTHDHQNKCTHSQNGTFWNFIVPSTTRYCDHEKKLNEKHCKICEKQASSPSPSPLVTILKVFVCCQVEAICFLKMCKLFVLSKIKIKSLFNFVVFVVVLI